MAYTTIDDPAQYFNTVLFTGDIVDGDGTGHDQAVTGVGFQPDWIWHKCRSHANQHIIVDSVRGTGGSPTQMLGLNSAASGAEVNSNTNGWIESIDSDGYTVTSGNDSSSKSNNAGANGRTYVAWNWLAGGSASSDTNGSINSSVSVNTTAGFSICSWTHDGGNSTIGHGLGAVPEVIITKERNASGSWNSYFASVGNAHRMVLQGTNAKISSSIWNSTTPTSTVFSMNDSISSTMIAYCFTEKKGYSKFGSYTGNGNANGAFAYTGFRPAWLMIKRFDDTSDWSIYDIKRENFNDGDPQYEFDLQIEANDGAAEGSDGQLGIYSNGFKFKSTDSFTNASDGEYLFMAFAEDPFVNSNGVPTNAR